MYDGNGEDDDVLIENFLKTYDAVLIRSSEDYEVQDITGEQLLELNCEAGQSAGGLDGWTTEDLGLMTLQGAQAIADLFNAIENGVRWPKIMCQAKDGQSGFPS